MKTNKIDFDNYNTILNKWLSEQTDNINNVLSGKLSASGSFLQTIHSLQYDFFIYDECDNIYGITFIIEDDIISFVSEKRNITVNSKEYALAIVDYFIKEFDISMTYLEENKQLKLHELIKYEKHYGKHIDSDIHKWLNYQFNDQAVAQAIAAGKGDTALGVVKEQYDNMQANIGNDNYSVYKENYNKALAEYSISAANGVAGVVGMSKIGSTNRDIAETNTKNDTSTVAGSAKAGLGISGGKGSPGEGANIGVGFSVEKSRSEQDSLTTGKSERVTNQFTRNELTSRIREEVTKGLDQGLSADQIDKNINENILSR